MPTQVQFRRGTTAQNNSFTGAAGEISIDTDKDALRVHDGTTQGGFEQAKVDLSNVSGATNLSLSGIITATSFSGDGSSLTNVSGMGTAVASTGFGADVFYTNDIGYVNATTTIASPNPSDAPILYTRYQHVMINNGYDLIIGNGNDFMLDVLKLESI